MYAIYLPHPEGWFYIFDEGDPEGDNAFDEYIDDSGLFETFQEAQEAYNYYGVDETTPDAIIVEVKEHEIEAHLDPMEREPDPLICGADLSQNDTESRDLEVKKLACTLAGTTVAVGADSRTARMIATYAFVTQCVQPVVYYRHGTVDQYKQGIMPRNVWLSVDDVINVFLPSENEEHAVALFDLLRAVICQQHLNPMVRCFVGKNMDAEPDEMYVCDMTGPAIKVSDELERRVNEENPYPVLTGMRPHQDSYEAWVGE